jgi:hypothetical protein
MSATTAFAQQANPSLTADTVTASAKAKAELNELRWASTSLSQNFNRLYQPTLQEAVKYVNELKANMDQQSKILSDHPELQDYRTGNEPSSTPQNMDAYTAKTLPGQPSPAPGGPIILTHSPPKVSYPRVSSQGRSWLKFQQ